MAQRLTDLDGKEVSLVTRAANRRRFLVLKSDGDEAMDDVKALKDIETIDKAGLGDAIEALTAADPTLTAALLEKSAMTEDEKRKIKAAMRVMGADLAKKMPGFLRAAGAMDDEDDDKEKKAMKKSEDEKPDLKPVAQITKGADGTWDLSALPAEQRPAFEAVIKSQEADATALRAELKKAADEAEASKAQLATLEAERERAAAIAKAAEFRDLPGANPDDMGPILVKIKKALEAAEYEKLTGILKASANVIRKSAVFSEIGAGDGSPTTARAELARKADELRKSEPSLTPQQARARVIKSDSGLMDRVNAEEAAQRQRARE